MGGCPNLSESPSDFKLRIPLVYNTSGYERVEMLTLLDGVVDIYLPGLKFMHPDKAEIYLAGAADYPVITQMAILEMHRQVGLLEADAEGIARRGLMIRHLVMPNRVAGNPGIRALGGRLPAQGDLRQHHAPVSRGLQRLRIPRDLAQHQRSGISGSHELGRCSRTSTAGPSFPNRARVL